jgi:hypothetical protein
MNVGRVAQSRGHGFVRDQNDAVATANANHRPAIGDGIQGVFEGQQFAGATECRQAEIVFGVAHFVVATCSNGSKSKRVLQCLPGGTYVYSNDRQQRQKQRSNFVVDCVEARRNGMIFLGVGRTEIRD